MTLKHRLREASGGLWPFGAGIGLWYLYYLGWTMTTPSGENYMVFTIMPMMCIPYIIATACIYYGLEHFYLCLKGVQ